MLSPSGTNGRKSGFSAGAGIGATPFVQLTISLVLGVTLVTVATIAPSSAVSLFVTDPWLDLPPALRSTISVALGVVLGAGVVFVARRWVLHTEAGRRWLETMGTPIASRARSGNAASAPVIAVVATIVAAVVEEIAFRGLLVPRTGVILPALGFALLHALAPRGARGSWAVASFLFALATGALFLATGDLTGPIAAHVLVNVANTRWIRVQYERLYGRDRTGETARRSGARPLGGLLGPRV